MQSKGDKSILGNIDYLIFSEYYTHKIPSKSSWTKSDFDLTHLPLDKIAAILAVDIFKCIFVNQNEIYSQESNGQWASIGSDNRLEPNRRQAIICANDDTVHWRIIAALGLMRRYISCCCIVAVLRVYYAFLSTDSFGLWQRYRSNRSHTRALIHETFIYGKRGIK